MKRVIAIDGPSGAGKSSVAKRIAREMGFDYLDTGALYRAVAVALTRNKISTEAPDEEIKSALKGIAVLFKDGKVFLDCEDVSTLIRTPEMGHYSSVYSARGPVRDSLLPLQREAAMHGDLVAEGRDMTTVVFPDAWRKFYLDATVEARALRRYLQLKAVGNETLTMDNATSDVAERDKRDSSRDIAPLRRADDAHYIDSSFLSLDQTVDAMLKIIRAEGSS